MKKVITFFLSLFLFSFSIACPCKQMKDGCPDCKRIIEKGKYMDKRLINPDKKGCEKCAKENKKKKERD